MLKLDSTLSTLVIASVVAGSIIFLASGRNRPAQVEGVSWSPSSEARAQGPAGTAPKPLWAASATGRIEPRDGEVRISALSPGKVVEVPAKANDRVGKGDMLVRIDDEDLLTRVQAAVSEENVRKRERDEEPAQGLALERRKAEDTVADAERVFFRARLAVDQAVANWRSGNGKEQDVVEARTRQAAAENAVAVEKGVLNRLLGKKDLPLPTRLESSLQTARAELLLAESAVDRAHVRAPFAGTVLNVFAKVGETVAASPEQPLVQFGDLTGLRVRAEVEERDAAKVRVGQKVVVRADAYPDKEFSGEVTSIAQTLAAPRITTRGPRRPNDVEVLEVQAALDGTPPLLTGMRVDVFFKLDTTAAK